MLKSGPAAAEFVVVYTSSNVIHKSLWVHSPRLATLMSFLHPSGHKLRQE